MHLWPWAWCRTPWVPTVPQTMFSDALLAAFQGWLRAETARERGGRLSPEIFCRLSPSMLGVILGSPRITLPSSLAWGSEVLLSRPDRRTCA